MSTGTRGIGKPARPGDHRCTPAAIYLACRHAAGISRWDLDPASNRRSKIPAEVSWYGAGPEDDGLRCQWFGNVWLNCPFSKMGPWSIRGVKQLKFIESLTFLGPGDSSTEWWRRMVKNVDAWAAWPGRPHFPMPGNATGGAPGPIHLFYAGPRSARWRRVMTHVGCVTYPGG